MVELKNVLLSYARTRQTELLQNVRINRWLNKKTNKCRAFEPVKTEFVQNVRINRWINKKTFYCRTREPDKTEFVQNVRINRLLNKKTNKCTSVHSRKLKFQSGRAGGAGREKVEIF